jgi:starch-binding outer membrane protein, SusD/RagB family
MKRIFLAFAIIIMMIISKSCSEDFLTKEPPGSAAGTVFYDEKGINALLIGTYAIVPGSSLWEVSWGASIQNWTYGSAASDDAYKGSEEGDQEPVNQIERWSVQTTNNYPREKWQLTLGMGVFRANQTLKVVQIAEDLGNITPQQANSFRAELRFLRALFNFEARLVFGDYIPILTEDTPDPCAGSQ